DRGPNTGGMGACSPAPIITCALQDQIMETIIYPTLKAFTQSGCPYIGFLYAGLMITPEPSPKVLEFNCRLGDPEAQIILFRLKSDLIALIHDAINERLNITKVEWDARSAVGVVIAAEGYPATYPQGDIIEGLAQPGPLYSKLFHAGTTLQNNQVKT